MLGKAFSLDFNPLANHQKKIGQLLLLVYFRFTLCVLLFLAYFVSALSAVTTYTLEFHMKFRD